MKKLLFTLIIISSMPTWALTDHSDVFCRAEAEFVEHGRHRAPEELIVAGSVALREGNDYKITLSYKYDDRFNWRHGVEEEVYETDYIYASENERYDIEDIPISVPNNYDHDYRGGQMKSVLKLFARNEHGTYVKVKECEGTANLNPRR